MPYKDPTRYREAMRARSFASHQRRAEQRRIVREAKAAARAAVARIPARRLWAHDDDDRGLRRLLIDLGLPTPPAPPQREVLRLQWHRAGAARTPVLVAVVRLPSTDWPTGAPDSMDRPRRGNDNVWRQG